MEADSENQAFQSAPTHMTSVITWDRTPSGFFTTLGLDLNFLEHNAESWEELESYQAALKAVKHLKVVNDAAERG